MNKIHSEILNVVETITNTYVIKENGASSFLEVVYKGKFIAVLIKGELEPISFDELLKLRLVLKAGGSAFIAFETSDWNKIQREIDGFVSSSSWTNIPNERYLDEQYAKKFSGELERGNGHLSLSKMPLFKEEELFGMTNHLPAGMLPL